MLNQMILRGIDRALGRHGYEVKPKSKPLRRASQFFAYASGCGFKARTVVDLGVGEGTPWLYDAFPKARLLLVEPNDAFRPAVERILARREGEVFWSAAGEEKGEATLHVVDDFPTSSSLAQRSEWLEKANRSLSLSEKVVPVAPLDELLAGETIETPLLVKIDVEGGELAAIRGGARTLDAAEMLIIETSIRQRFDDAPDLAAVIAEVSSLGFKLFDVIDMQQMGANGPLCFLDVVFVRADSALWDKV